MAVLKVILGKNKRSISPEERGFSYIMNTHNTNCYG